MGLNFVLFLGAIQSIPGGIYEAAELDGATRWQQFRYIIAPSIKPIISLSFILAVSGSIAVFEIPFMLYFGLLATKSDQARLIWISVLIAVLYYALLAFVQVPWQIYPLQILSAAVTAPTRATPITATTWR